ncbi:hypothetical protein BJ875DRAFT_109216 [Amylocarpus encephaloides]|uniref:Transposase n=1 Tax=Amylocarpus encephaloides TaxID=45428 RepID=A0A9P7YRB1_9HELO|nr:hypothetical protein BJ875DRAFT_109216 [Amylocarpus encephaloides]
MVRLSVGQVKTIKSSIRSYHAHDEPVDYEVIAFAIGCPKSAVYYHERIITGVDNLPIQIRKGKPGPRPAIQPWMQDEIVKLWARKPETCQDEIVDFLYDEFGLKIHQSTVSRCLSGLKSTRKVMKKVAAQQNEELRD